MKYVIGLDIGIASVGWSVIDAENKRIIDLGVRAFDRAEVPKTGASLAEPRRTARGMRRRLVRRAERLRRAKQLFVDSGLIKESEIESAFLVKNDKSPWDLRLKGLDFKLTSAEFTRALFHIVKHRGFKSNRKNEKASKDEFKMLGAIKRNQEILESKKYRTVGEMVANHKDFTGRKRNTTGDYTKTFTRSMLEDEIRILFSSQRNLGNQDATQELECKLLEIFNWQKPFASGDDILKMIGKCRFEKSEYRAPKRAYTVEIFDLIHSINTRLRWHVNGEQHSVAPDQFSLIIDEAHKVNKLDYHKIRELLNLTEDARFDCVDYRSKKADANEEELVKSPEEGSDFFSLIGYHSIRKACAKEDWQKICNDSDALDTIAYALTIYKDELEVVEYLSNNHIPESIAKAVIHCTEFSKTSNISMMAIKKILPFMKEGQQYHDACTSAGYNHALQSQTPGKKSRKLPKIDPEEIRNPVVIRALSQTRKVINAIIGRYGSPWRIHIELAREMGKSYETRREIEKEQKENEKKTASLREEFEKEFGFTPNSTDLLKLRLYKEQHCKCLYSLKPLDISRLFENNYAEIDHILPYSRSFDNSRNNLALVLAAENQNKRNKTPFEYFGSDEIRWNNFEAYVKSLYLSQRKRNNLLKKVYDESTEEEWRSRNLNDTRYITRYITNHIKENLKFAEKQDKQSVVCLNGQLVAHVRYLWGLPKDREEDDLHHALDATVIASILPHNQEELTRYYQGIETNQINHDPETGEVLERSNPKMPRPWRNFRRELLARLSDNPSEQLAQLDLPAYSKEEIEKIRPVLVSRMPRRKISGELHEETIRSAKRVSTDGVSTVRKPLTSLTKDDLKNLSNPDANKELYAEIRRRMEQHDNKAEKAFAEPLYKPFAKKPTLVRSVTVMKKQNTGVPVRGGLADNSTMVRTDVYKRNGKYYLVPVYRTQIKSGYLPDRAIVADTREDDWLLMDEQSSFVTSLYPYDLFVLELAREPELCYYKGCDRAKGSIKFIPPNKNLKDPMRKGVQSAQLIQRYEMGILGDYYPVRKKEVRHGLENRGRGKPRKVKN